MHICGFRPGKVWNDIVFPILSCKKKGIVVGVCSAGMLSLLEWRCSRPASASGPPPGDGAVAVTKSRIDPQGLAA